MKNLFTSILFVVLSTASFSLKAQWFNDNMGSATSGTAPCPWVNTGLACNPAGVTNLGVCATGTSSGNPAWTLGVGGSGGAYGWNSTSTGNTGCTLTYTLNVTGTVTITGISFQPRRSITGATTISTFTINGTPKTPIPNTVSTAYSLASVTVSPAITVTNGTLTIVIGFTGADAAAGSSATRIDDFQISGSTAVLPVELTDFDVKYTPLGNKLRWKTATETNNEGFDIETSKDGVNFQSLEFVKGRGTTSKAQNYTFTHRLADNENGVLYYRLKQMDIDGKFEYSKIIVVRSEGKKNSVVVYPNPSNGLYTIVLDEKAEIEQISLMTVTGQSIDVNISNNQLDLTNEAAGVYFLQVNGENIRLIKN